MISDKWKRRLMIKAQLVASWSKDPDRQCGALIVDDDRRGLGEGYNGFPRGVGDDPGRYSEKFVKLKMVVHAEANALANCVAPHLLRGSTMIATSYPCSDCAKLIIQFGVTTVITTPAKTEGHWAEDAEFSRQMFREAGVTVIVDVGAFVLEDGQEDGGPF